MTGLRSHSQNEYLASNLGQIDFKAGVFLTVGQVRGE